MTGDTGETGHVGAAGVDDLQRAVRELNAELRAQQEELEAAAEHTDRASRSMAEVALEFLYRGDAIRVVVGERIFMGQVTHVGTGVMTLRSPAGSEIDIAYEGLSSIRVVQRSTAPGRSRTSTHPGELVARLRELENTGEAVELGGAGLRQALEATVSVVAGSHMELRARDGSEWVLPLSQIGYVIRAGGPSR